MPTWKQTNDLLDFLALALTTWTGATILHVGKIGMDDSKTNTDLVGATLFGMVGIGVICSLVYQTEVGFYGFSPSFERK